jgi:hypothetical protein
MLSDTTRLPACTNADLRPFLGTVRHRSELTHNPSVVGSSRVANAILQPGQGQKQTRDPSILTELRAAPTANAPGSRQATVAEASSDPAKLWPKTQGVKPGPLIKFKRSRKSRRTHFHFLGGWRLGGQRRIDADRTLTWGHDDDHHGSVPEGREPGYSCSARS